MTAGRRAWVIAEANALLGRHWSSAKAGANCIHAAAAVLLACNKVGLRAIPQGGSASWPRLAESEDDGTVATHFTFEFTPIGDVNALFRNVIVSGNVPEIHAWVVVFDGDRPEVVDITVSHWPERCERELGLRWTAPMPPDALWCGPDELVERRVRYAADPEATVLVSALIARLIHEAASEVRACG